MKGVVVVVQHDHPPRRRRCRRPGRTHAAALGRRGGRRHDGSSVSMTASAITRSGRPETWLAFRSRANASASLRAVLHHQRPFARSIALRATSASESESASARAAIKLLVAGARSLDRGHDVLFAEGLDEVAVDAGLGGAIDQLLCPNAVSITIGMGRSLENLRAASIPSRRGILTSITARSGRTSRASATASSPSRASADDLVTGPARATREGQDE